MRPLTLDEIQTAVNWAAAEGWNPGHQDAQCFAAQDPEGFWGGFLNGRLIATISVVNYDAHFAFLGFYIVHPDHRGKGYGYALWRNALEHEGSRTVGLDGVVDQQANYVESGFAFAYNNSRFSGRIGDAIAKLPEPPEGAIQLLDKTDRDLFAFDRTAFPASRDPFLNAWLNAPGHICRAIHGNGTTTGYGVLRPCREGYKIGPLFTDTPQEARLFLGALLRGAPDAAQDAPFFLDVPTTHPAAMELAGNLGLEVTFSTARMYKGPAPEIEISRIYGVTSFELG